MQYVSRSTTIEVHASVDETLPLFTADGERLWVNGWNPIFVYPESGEARTGTIWTTDVDEDTEAVWVTVNYDEVMRCASYLKWTPEKHVTRIDIQCKVLTSSKTLVHVTYTLTALSAKGHADIQKLTAEYYDNWIASWQTSVNHYLQFGEMLPAH